MRINVYQLWSCYPNREKTEYQLVGSFDESYVRNNYDEYRNAVEELRKEVEFQGGIFKEVKTHLLQEDINKSI